MRTLIVAAGGGGDALGALLLRRLVAGDDAELPIATFAWERLRVDPVPGPRGVAGFAQLGDVAGLPMEVTPVTETIPLGRSTLPRLVRETGARLFLLDAGAGVTGLTRQLDHLAVAVSANRLALVDIGGDVLADGSEPEVRSPLADALALASAAATGLPTVVHVAGPGLDAELPETDVLSLLDQRHATLAGTLVAADVQPLSSVLDWHPSEASVLMAAAALGIRGRVETRRGGIPVPLTDHSPGAWTATLASVLAGAGLARALSGTSSIEEANAITRELSVSELDYEHARAEAVGHLPAIDPAAILDRARRYAAESLARGADLISTRRLAEAIDLPGEQTALLVQRLAAVTGARRGALWDLRALQGRQA